MPTPQYRLLLVCADLMASKRIDRYYVDAVRMAATYFANGEPIMATKIGNSFMEKTDKTGKVKTPLTKPKQRTFPEMSVSTNQPFPKGQ